MHALKTAVAVAWIVFWVGWLASAAGARKGAAARSRYPLAGLSALAVLVLVRAFHDGSLTVHSVVVGTFGAALFALGIALAIWARVHLGRNWGMPMTRMIDPELVTSGPYRFVRHPIYSGLLLGLLGTALVTSLIGLTVVLVFGAYFYYSASVEEKNLGAAFPAEYSAYRARTKMLVPFLL